MVWEQYNTITHRQSLTYFPLVNCIYFSWVYRCYNKEKKLVILRLCKVQVYNSSVNIMQNRYHDSIKMTSFYMLQVVNLCKNEFNVFQHGSDLSKSMQGRRYRGGCGTPPHSSANRQIIISVGKGIIGIPMKILLLPELRIYK
jgi:hypothetical protein